METYFPEATFHLNGQFSRRPEKKNQYVIVVTDEFLLVLSIKQNASAQHIRIKK